MRPFVLMCVAVVCLSQGLLAGDCGSAMNVRVLAVREPVRPVLSILSRIREARTTSCSGAAVASCSGATVRVRVAPMASCSGVRAVTSCAGSVRAPQAYGLGLEAKTVQPTSVRSTGLAQQKAEQQASEGRMRHVGGSFGGGTREGVGFSSVSADDAIRHCCYYGQYTPREIGVARGSRGWYATVIY